MMNQLSFVFFLIYCYSIQINASPINSYKNRFFDDASLQFKNSKLTIADSISSFSLDLMKTLQYTSRENENVVCSPVNVYGALALLLLGASGTTWDEIRGAMKLPYQNQQGNLDQIHTEISNLLKQIQNENIRVGNRTVSQVSLAYGIFVEEHQRIKKSYENSVHNYYSGHIKKLDFSDGYAAINEINRWISAKTSGQISKIFSEPLDQQSSVVEATSVYFSGGWSERFSHHMTKTEPFYTGSRNIYIKMMNNKGRIPYLNNPRLKYESIQLDFHGRHYSAVFVLPYPEVTISNLVDSLNTHDLNEILNQTTYRGVNYKIPRMKFFSSKSLKEPLHSKGLRKLFEKANLSSMLESSGQKISDITHAVEIEVDESGAKATAVTSVRIEPLAAKNPPENTTEFYLDRPFLMMINHRISGTILFSAIVREPMQ